jgi:hypothetical protein
MIRDRSPAEFHYSILLRLGCSQRCPWTVKWPRDNRREKGSWNWILCFTRIWILPIFRWLKYNFKKTKTAVFVHNRTDAY